VHGCSEIAEKYLYIAWHRPDKATDGSAEQQALCLRACSHTQGLLETALQELQEKRAEIQEKMPDQLKNMRAPAECRN